MANRRGFLKALGIGGAAAAVGVTPKSERAVTPSPVRPHTPASAMRMLKDAASHSHRWRLVSTQGRGGKTLWECACGAELTRPLGVTRRKCK